MSSKMTHNPWNGEPLASLEGGISLSSWRLGVNQWLFNPWTGGRRDTRDVISDPVGLLIVREGDPVKAYCQPKLATAPALLNKAADLMAERGKQYDQPQGERSMGRAVAALNIVLGREALTESEGWLLMQILKDVRDRQRSAPHPDSLEDCVAYAALKAEARLQEVTK